MNELEQRIMFLQLKMEIAEAKHDLMIEMKEMEARLIEAIKEKKASNERQIIRKEDTDA